MNEVVAEAELSALVRKRLMIHTNVFIINLLHNFILLLAPACFDLKSWTSSGSYKNFQHIQRIWPRKWQTIYISVSL